MVRNLDAAAFKKSARFIVKRNVSARVDRVFASFEPQDEALRLIYCTSGGPTDDDLEDCETTCAELIAEFPEIKKAETQCLASDEYVFPNDPDEVFSRS